MTPNKPIHVKPSLYAYYFLSLKEIALKYGYNLVVHGSMARDLDLIAIPWEADVKPYIDMIEEFREHLRGTYNTGNGDVTHHGRIHYVINLNRGGYQPDKSFTEDPQYYIDISVMPALKTISNEPAQ